MPSKVNKIVCFRPDRRFLGKIRQKDKKTGFSPEFPLFTVDLRCGDFYSDVCPKFLWIWGDFAVMRKFGNIDIFIL